MSLEICLGSLCADAGSFSEAMATAFEVKQLYGSDGVEYANAIGPTVRLNMVAHDLMGELF